MRVAAEPTVDGRSSAALDVETSRTDEDYARIDAVLAEAFGGVFAASAEAASRLRRIQDSGGAVRFVRAPDGGCVGAASCSASAVGTAELAGVGTGPGFRGRAMAPAGCASTSVTARRAAGCTWCSKDDVEARAGLQSLPRGRRTSVRQGYDIRGSPRSCRAAVYTSAVAAAALAQPKDRACRTAASLIRAERAGSSAKPCSARA